MTDWMCAQAIPGTEGKLQSKFLRLGVESYLPLTRTRIHDCNDHTYNRTVAFFPGYLFARPDERGRIRLSISDLSVRPRWVDFGEGAVSIPNEFIEELRAREEGGYIFARSVSILENEPRLVYRRGETVHVTGGPFAGIDGICTEDAGARVVLLLQLLGGMRPVTVDKRDVA